MYIFLCDQILGSGMSNKMWDALIEHAKTCALSGNLYIYYSDDSRTVGVVFNNIYELIGLIAGEQYYSADSLSDSQKVCICCGGRNVFPSPPFSCMVC